MKNYPYDKNKPRERHKLTKRKEIFERDGNKCVVCKSTESLTLDHLKPKSKGGGDEDSNLQTLCRRCNQLKGGHNISNKELKLLLNPKALQKRYASILVKLATAKSANLQQIEVLDEYRNTITALEHAQAQTNKRVVELQKENSAYREDKMTNGISEEEFIAIARIVEKKINSCETYALYGIQHRFIQRFDTSWKEYTKQQQENK
jgi:hypothetical protein